MNYLVVVKGVLLITLFGFTRDVSKATKNVISKKEVTFLVAFGKAYGYVRYFYPSDLEQGDWEKICIKGIQTITDTDNNSGLAATLQTFFQPLAPLISFDAAANETNTIIAKSNTQLVYHEYYGLNTGDKYSDYKNYLRKISIKSGQAYSSKRVSKLIAPSVYINMPTIGPLVKLTPMPNAYELTGQEALNSMKTIWLCKAIITWNIIQHFYPYREDIKDWENILFQTISAILASDDKNSCKEAYNKMIAALSDGHAVYIDKENNTDNYCLPLELVIIDKALYVREAMGDNSLFYKGDEITSINGVPIAKLKEKADLLNSGGEAFRNELFCLSLISGNKNDSVHIALRRNAENKTASLVYSLTPLQYNLMRIKQGLDSLFFDNRSIGYFDLRKWEYKRLKKIIPNINKLKGVVFDLRGYPTADIDYLLQHLITFKDTAKNWLSVPIITSPDFESVSFKNEGWALVPTTPRITTRTIFLCDARTYSFAESILGFVKDYKLGTIIGEATAGSNGDISSISFSDKSSFTWSSVKVTTPTGILYKSKGINADILVKQTPSSLASGKDLPLEKALEEIRK